MAALHAAGDSLLPESVSKHLDEEGANCPPARKKDSSLLGNDRPGRECPPATDVWEKSPVGLVQTSS